MAERTGVFIAERTATRAELAASRHILPSFEVGTLTQCQGHIAAALDDGRAYCVRISPMVRSRDNDAGAVFRRVAYVSLDDAQAAEVGEWARVTPSMDQDATTAVDGAIEWDGKRWRAGDWEAWQRLEDESGAVSSSAGDAGDEGDERPIVAVTSRGYAGAPRLVLRRDRDALDLMLTARPGPRRDTASLASPARPGLLAAGAGLVATAGQGCGVADEVRGAAESGRGQHPRGGRSNGL